MRADPAAVYESVRASERDGALLDAAAGAARYTLATFAVEAGIGLLLALLLVVAFRCRSGYLPEWVRRVLGVRRTLHSRAELRPRPSALRRQTREHPSGVAVR